MAGIYVHIPFCKQACNYCNFYFVTNVKQKSALVDAICIEIEQTKYYLCQEPIETIYFGGGTPSLLSREDFEIILSCIKKHHHLALKEITIECNPDDLTDEKIAELKSLQSLGLNRLSIGVQSFFDHDLSYMQRAHNATEAKAAIEKAHKASFENLTIDLIYGTPGLTDANWIKNLDWALSLGVQHLSCYALTVESKTKLQKDISNQKVVAPKDQQAVRQFDILMDWAAKNSFNHYEISNFAKPGHEAIHNTNYWKGKKYLGLGPAAHSYNGESRQWNVANLNLYLKAIKQAESCFSIETLTPQNKTNEYIMTSLRTMWGCDIQQIDSLFQKTILNNLESIDSSFYVFSKDVIKLTQQGKHYADYIASQLFLS